jgi:4-azaleucine resistance transporter AzlC
LPSGRRLHHRDPVRSAWRSLEQRLGARLLRDIALVWVAVGLVGASYGAISVSEGFPVWMPSLMSVTVFAGASQFLYTGIVGAGGSPVAAVLAGLLVNARHLPFGFAMADTVRGHRVLGSFLMIDESVAFGLAQRDPVRRRLAYFTCAVGLFLSWNLGTLVGALAGAAITDTDALGLDAAFPAVLLALVLPSLRDRVHRNPALLGAVVALALTPFLPPGLPVLCSLAGLVLAVRRPVEESGS